MGQSGFSKATWPFPIGPGCLTWIAERDRLRRSTRLRGLFLLAPAIGFWIDDELNEMGIDVAILFFLVGWLAGWQLVIGSPLSSLHGGKARLASSLDTLDGCLSLLTLILVSSLVLSELSLSLSRNSSLSLPLPLAVTPRHFRRQTTTILGGKITREESSLVVYLVPRVVGVWWVLEEKRVRLPAILR